WGHLGIGGQLGRRLAVRQVEHCEVEDRSPRHVTLSAVYALVVERSLAVVVRLVRVAVPSGLPGEAHAIEAAELDENRAFVHVCSSLRCGCNGCCRASLQD